MRGRVLLCAAGCLLTACWTEEGPGETAGNGNPACADFLCEETLIVEVERRDREVFLHGEYLFSLGQEHPRVTCVLPTGGAEECSGDTDMMAVTLDDSRRVFTLRFGAVPLEIYVEVQLDGGIIGGELLAPDIHLIVPPNPECTESCVQGKATMTVQSDAVSPGF